MFAAVLTRMFAAAFMPVLTAVFAGTRLRVGFPPFKGLAFCANKCSILIVCTCRSPSLGLGREQLLLDKYRHEMIGAHD